MDFLTVVQIFQAFENELQDGGDFVFVEFFFSDVDNISNTSCHTILHNDPQVVVFEVGAIILDNVIVITLSQNCDLDE